MKLRPKFYLYAAFGAGVAAIVIYFLVSPSDNKKAAEAMHRPAATQPSRNESVDNPSTVTSTEKRTQTAGVPTASSPGVVAAKPTQPLSPTQVAANEEKPAAENTPAASASAGANTSLPPESIATRRMYVAHASLRAPEVADPDSETNRRVLSTMVMKALVQSRTPVPSSTLSK